MSAWILIFIAVVTAVRPPPNITKFAQKDLIDKDEVKFDRKNGFSLPCEASGSNLTWTWKHNGTTVGYRSNYSLSEDGTLTGNDLKAKHSGTYQCFVKDNITGVEVFSRKLQVAVTVVGDFINTEDVMKKVDLGKPFSFQCPDHKPSFGADYNWVGSQHVQFSRTKRRGISPDGGLYIMYVTQEDIDEIRDKRGLRCKVSGAGEYRESGTLKLVKNSEDPGTRSSPSWAVKPEAEEIAIEGRSKTLYCLAIGRPAPNITWNKNGQRIVDGQNSFEIPAPFHGRRLKINSVSKERPQNQYSCKAENAVSNGQPLIHNITLAVEVVPKWTVKPPPQKMDIVIGTNGTLECHVTAAPPAPVKWYKDGIQLESSHAHLRIYGEKLHFVDVPLDSDGVYQCTVENRHGMIASATWVRVLAWKPSFSDGQFGPFRLQHGSQGRLQCQPSAAPPPSIQWFRNGDLISYGDSSRYELETNGTLVIKEVNKELDAANFTCRAENFMGADSATSFAAVLQVVPDVYQQDKASVHVYSQAWFVTVLTVAAFVLLFVVVVFSKGYRQGLEHRYNVKLRERKYGAMKCQERQGNEEIQEREQQNDGEEEHGTFLEKTDTRNEPQDLCSMPLSSHFSEIDETLFAEDASFADEYKETDVTF